MQEPKIPNESFVFYRSFWDGIKHLTIEQRDEALSAIFSYAFDGVAPEKISGAVRTSFTMAKPQIDANIRKRENGFKGGRPKRNETTPDAG